jgi:23S rRNA pseudouridine1911/1915/1917 synthase
MARPDASDNGPSPDSLEYRAEVPDTLSGRRLDQALAILFPDFSRSRLQAWIKTGRVTVDGLTRRPRDLVLGGERVRLRAEPEDRVEAGPEPIPLSIVFEDDTLLVIDKPAGLVVHPGAGNPGGTLQNALLHHRPELRLLPRAGLVHRLDKDTSGLMVVAASEAAHAALVRAMEAREIRREYEAVCVGVMTAGGTVDAPVGRHPVDRLRMAVRETGKPARTHYRVLDRYRGHTRVLCRLETGRTHQIRVHMAHIRYPLVGDALYGGRLAIPRGATPGLAETLRRFRRQALHARRLALVHPATGEEVAWESPLPADFAGLVAALETDRGAGETVHD